jgi:hypothetical protein
MTKPLSERMRMEAANLYLDDELVLGFSDEVAALEAERDALLAMIILLMKDGSHEINLDVVEAYFNLPKELIKRIQDAIS